MREEYFVTEETAGDRIDKFLAEQYENLSRSFLQKLLKSGEGRWTPGEGKLQGG